MIARLLFGVALAALATLAHAQNNYPSVGGATVPLVVSGCLDGSGKAIPATAAGTCASGGGGGGGAATVADGADVTQGTTTDAACGTDNGTCTAIALYKRIAQRLTSILAKLPALGTAGSSSTDVITVQGIASGTALPISAASLPLMTGAATAANQATEISSLATIATNTGAAIPAGSAIIGKVGIDQTTPGTTNGVQVNAALPAGTNDIGNVGGRTNVTPTDCSGTITSGGTAQNAHTAQSTLRGMTIANLDATEVLWISFTTTAAASGTGSYPLAPATATTFAGLASYTTPLGFGYNTALSVIAATTGHKFSCTRW